VGNPENDLVGRGEGLMGMEKGGGSERRSSKDLVQIKGKNSHPD